MQNLDAQIKWQVVLWLAICFVLLALLTIIICTVTILNITNRHRELQLLSSGLVSPLRPVLTSEDLHVLDRHMRAYDSSGSEETCAICCEVLVSSETVVQIPICLHVFHPKCLREWLVIKAVCPNCKGDMLTALGIET